MPGVKVPVGRALRPTVSSTVELLKSYHSRTSQLTYFNLDEEQHKRKMSEDVESSEQNGNEVAVIMVSSPVSSDGIYLTCLR